MSLTSKCCHPYSRSSNIHPTVVIDSTRFTALFEMPGDEMSIQYYRLWRIWSISDNIWRNTLYPIVHDLRTDTQRNVMKIVNNVFIVKFETRYLTYLQLCFADLSHSDALMTLTISTVSMIFVKSQRIIARFLHSAKDSKAILLTLSSAPSNDTS